MISCDKHNAMVSLIILVNAVTVFYASFCIASPYYLPKWGTSSFGPRTTHLSAPRPRLSPSSGPGLSLKSRPLPSTYQLPSPYLQPSTYQLPSPNLQPSTYQLPSPYLQPSTYQLPSPYLQPSTYQLPSPYLQPSPNIVARPMQTKPSTSVKIPVGMASFALKGKNDKPISFPGSEYVTRDPIGQSTSSWYDRDGMHVDQRMLLPRGYSIPKEMYGPNYIWDTKGWPRLITTTPEPVHNTVKALAKNTRPNDSPIIFRENPSWSLHSATSSHPPINKQIDNQNNGLEENANSSFSSEDIEPRISKGRKTPKELLQTTPAFDDKGWPRFLATTRNPTLQDIDTTLEPKLNDKLILVR